jgi:DNA-binding transcriptional regulator YiaG
MSSIKIEETARKIVLLRAGLGLTSTQFAKSLNVSQPCIKKWEEGRTLPNAHQLIKLYERYNVEPSWLLLDHECNLTEKKT